MKYIIAIVLVLSLFMLGCSGDINELCTDEGYVEECPTCEVCEVAEEPAEQAMLTIRFDEWGTSALDDSEVIMGYYIVNYGLVEAKDIEVTCSILDKDDKILKTKTENVGNLASEDFEYMEMIVDYKSEDTAEEFGRCRITGCKDCLNLDKRIFND